MSTKASSTQSLLSKIIESAIYKSALGKAPRIAKNAKSLLKLLQTTLTKTQELGVGGIFDVIREKITIMGTLIKAYAVGDYRQIELGSLVKIIAAFVYFISPIDIIPDFLPFSTCSLSFNTCSKSLSCHCGKNPGAWSGATSPNTNMGSEHTRG